MKLVRRINEQGVWQEDVIVKDDEEIPTDCVDLPYNGGLILPKFYGTEWVEGASQERLDEIEAEKNKLLPPTQDQRIKDLENMIVGLMDVILMGGM